MPKPAPERYQLTVTAEQAGIISKACELVARLQMGQWTEFLHHLPDMAPTSYWDGIEGIAPIMERILPARNDKPAPRSRLESNAWHLHTLIRHRLAWDESIAQGHTDGKRRNWDNMLGVQWDEPYCDNNCTPASIKARR